MGDAPMGKAPELAVLQRDDGFRYVYKVSDRVMTVMVVKSQSGNEALKTEYDFWRDCAASRRKISPIIIPSPLGFFREARSFEQDYNVFLPDMSEEAKRKNWAYAVDLTTPMRREWWEVLTGFPDSIPELALLCLGLDDRADPTATTLDDSGTILLGPTAAHLLGLDVHSGLLAKDLGRLLSWIHWIVKIDPVEFNLVLGDGSLDTGKSSVGVFLSLDIAKSAPRTSVTNSAENLFSLHRTCLPMPGTRIWEQFREGYKAYCSFHEKDEGAQILDEFESRCNGNAPALPA